MGHVKASRTDEVCLACEGAGMVPSDHHLNDPARIEDVCPVCNGLGTVEPEGNMDLSEWQRRHDHNERMRA